MKQPNLLVLLVTAILMGCTIYLPNEKWARSVDTSLSPSDQATQIKLQEKHFRSDFISCMIKYESTSRYAEHIYDANVLSQMSDSQIDRLANSMTQNSTIRECMTDKHWHPFPG
jgi:hypothetical protein